MKRQSNIRADIFRISASFIYLGKDGWLKAYSRRVLQKAMLLTITLLYITRIG